MLIIGCDFHTRYPNRRLRKKHTPGNNGAPSSPVVQDRNYRGLEGFGNRTSRRRINSTALSIASRNAFSLAGDGRRSRPANRRTKNIPATR